MLIKDGNFFKKNIEFIFDFIRGVYCPDVNDDMLLDEGAIYYMNGEDPTPASWLINSFVPPFKISYKNGNNFIIVGVADDDTVHVYYWDSDEGGEFTDHVYDFKFTFSPYELACLMDYIADSRGLYDVPINVLNWDVSTDDTVCIEDIIEHACAERRRKNG